MSEERLTVQRWNGIISPLNAMLSNAYFHNPDSLFDPPGIGNLLGFATGMAHTAGNIIRLSSAEKTGGDRITKQDFILLDKQFIAYQRDLGVTFEEPIRATKQRIETYEERILWGLDAFENNENFPFTPGSTYWAFATTFIKFGQFLFDSYLAAGSPNARSYTILLGVVYDGPPFFNNFGFSGNIINNVLQGHTNTDEWDVGGLANPPIQAGMTVWFLPYQDPDGTDGAMNFPQAANWMTFESDLAALIPDEVVDLLTLPY